MVDARALMAAMTARMAYKRAQLVADTRQRDVGELSQPEFDQAADGFGTADLLALCLDPIIDRFQLLIMHADDLGLARTSCLRAAHFWIGLRGITN